VYYQEQFGYTPTERAVQNAEVGVHAMPTIQTMGRAGEGGTERV